MRISTVVLGKAVRNAGISGRHVITKLMQKIQSIGQTIERWERDKVQIPGTKIALERAILDALCQRVDNHQISNCTFVLSHYQRLSKQFHHYQVHELRLQGCKVDYMQH